MRKLLYGLASFAIAATMVGSARAADNAPQVFKINPTGNGAQQSGTITFETQGTGTKITVSLKGEPQDAIQPAHIHVGPCKHPGGVKIPLTSVVGGKSVTIVKVPIDQAAVAGTSVNVHKSKDEISVYVACGDIQFAMTGK